jgi:predicted GNAT superfamily acetyltransferase
VRASESRAGVTIRTVDDHPVITDARRIFDEVWPPLGGGTQLPPNLFIALLHAGGYACVAYASGAPVGATMGFLGEGNHIHSHMAGVVESHRNQHIGTAMKLHQRAWCLDRGIDTVVWTFDPLVKRNARLNITKLGVDVEGYEPDYYGEMPDAINAGDPTDRVFAVWRLGSDTARRALTDHIPSVIPAPDDRIIAIPDDIVAIRQHDPVEAQRWRMEVRSRMMGALDEGFVVRGLTDEGDYVMRAS